MRRETNYLRALELAEQRGMRPLVVRCLLGLAQGRDRAGDFAAASGYRERGIRLATELGMSLATLDTA